uniref:Uncharacterized protein n=1 Tax=Triticum urartu TaxID=4572 RepID=A0A8R7P997_TRIUA
MQKLPDSVCQLRQLGYLNLSGCSWLMTLPESFGGLLNLRYINLSRCSRLMTLPESFGALLNLRYINLSGCSQLMTLPESFGGLLNLWYINLSRCNRLAELPESFGKLKSLTYLDLSFWCCCEGIWFLGGLTSLEHLNLSHPCCYLPQHREHLVGLKDVLCKLVNLQYLNLSMCMNPIFCYLSEEECRQYIQSCTSGLSNLQHLDLSHNIFLDGLPESLGELQKLHTLDLTGCTRLESVANESDSLNLVVIRNCRGLESCSFVVRTDDGRFSSNLVQLENVNCQDLEITCLEKVKSREEAQRIRLVEKRNVKELTLGWTVGSHGSVENDANLLGELKPPHDLQRLKLHGYRATCLPDWMGCLTSLQELCICKCRVLKYLPRGIKGLDNLKNLQIIECPRLENWCKENKKKLGRIQPTYG